MKLLSFNLDAIQKLTPEEFESKFTVKPGIFKKIGNWFKGLFEKGPNSFVGITGRTISSTEIEIDGVVSKGNPFTYNLDEGANLISFPVMNDVSVQCAFPDEIVNNRAVYNEASRIKEIINKIII